MTSSTLEPLTHDKHKDLRLSAVSNFNFARQTLVVKLSYSELRHASRCFPVVFLSDGALPQAILTLGSKENICLDADGNWQMPYIPVFFRLYPFTLAKVEAQSDQYALCLDPGAEHFASEMGEPLFKADGTPADLIGKKIMPALQQYQKELELTEQIFRPLVEQGIVTDQELKYTVKQKEQKINGFKAVDMEKLKALDDSTLAGMVKNGTIGLVHEHVQSLGNFPGVFAG